MLYKLKKVQFLCVCHVDIQFSSFSGSVVDVGNGFLSNICVPMFIFVKYGFSILI